MKNYMWWAGRKKRLKKKYHLYFMYYWSPKEVKDWYFDWVNHREPRVKLPTPKRDPLGLKGRKKVI